MRSATPAEWCEKVCGDDDGKNSRVNEDLSDTGSVSTLCSLRWRVNSHLEQTDPKDRRLRVTAKVHAVHESSRERDDVLRGQPNTAR